MSNEDEIVAKLVEIAHSGPEFSDVEVEAHYNHYGTRGVADLLVRDYQYVADTEDEAGQVYRESVYEVKSESALRGSTGANEVIRQFQQMRRYFFEDEDRERRSIENDNSVCGVTFHLVFEATPYTLRHLMENKTLYKSLDEQSGLGDVRIFFRTAGDEETIPGHADAVWGDSPAYALTSMKTTLADAFGDALEEFVYSEDAKYTERRGIEPEDILDVQSD